MTHTKSSVEVSLILLSHSHILVLAHLCLTVLTVFLLGILNISGLALPVILALGINLLLVFYWFYRIQIDISLLKSYLQGTLTDVDWDKAFVLLGLRKDSTPKTMLIRCQNCLSPLKKITLMLVLYAIIGVIISATIYVR